MCCKSEVFHLKVELSSVQFIVLLTAHARGLPYARGLSYARVMLCYAMYCFSDASVQYICFT
jgi:hypothetical protein